MTIAVVTTVHTYEQYLPEWGASVLGLDTAPDEVVVSASHPDRVRTWLGDEFMDVLGPILTVVETPDPWNWGNALNQAVEATQSDWIAWIGVDDHYRPQALSGIDRAATDVVGFGLRFFDGTYINVPVRPPKPSSIIDLSYGNLIIAGSPFRRHVWEANPFNTDATPYEDWAFWVDAALAGFTFGVTARIDYEYRVHDGQRRPDESAVRAYMQARIDARGQ